MSARPAGGETPRPSAEARAELVRELRHALVPQLLERWYPRVIDEEFGGFLSDLDLDFRPGTERHKELVTQARHLWSTSRAAGSIPDDPRYRRVADHGFRYLRDVMWDDLRGGFFARVYPRSADGVWPGSGGEPTGLMSRGRHLLRRYRIVRTLAASMPFRTPPPPIRPKPKDAYDQAFAIFALAAYYELTADPGALELAQRTFDWLEANHHDAEDGGYRRFVEGDGSPLVPTLQRPAPKDFDSTLHLLEAFVELYRVQPTDAVRQRLEELLLIIRDRGVTERSTSWLDFADDWTPIRSAGDSVQADRDPVSFGHDMEAAALLLDAAAVLGPGDDAATHAVAKRLTDQALEHSWDLEHGGLYGAGFVDAHSGQFEVDIESKIYWAQAEALNTLSLFAERYPDDPRDYFARFRAQWQYCQKYVIDQTRGGWFFRGLDDLPEAEQPGKGRPIHGTYHVARALMESIARFS